MSLYVWKLDAKLQKESAICKCLAIFFNTNPLGLICKKILHETNCLQSEFHESQQHFFNVSYTRNKNACALF